MYVDTVRCITKDHPHAYGDKGGILRVTIESLGSSPRVWGQVNVFDLLRYL